MKWKNIDAGSGYCYITATCTAWLPLPGNAQDRKIVCEEISRATRECGGCCFRC